MGADDMLSGIVMSTSRGQICVARRDQKCTFKIDPKYPPVEAGQWINWLTEEGQTEPSQIFVHQGEPPLPTRLDNNGTVEIQCTAAYPDPKYILSNPADLDDVMPHGPFVWSPELGWIADNERRMTKERQVMSDHLYEVTVHIDPTDFHSFHLHTVDREIDGLTDPRILNVCCSPWFRHAVKIAPQDVSDQSLVGRDISKVNVHQTYRGIVTEQSLQQHLREHAGPMPSVRGRGGYGMGGAVGGPGAYPREYSSQYRYTVWSNETGYLTIFDQRNAQLDQIVELGAWINFTVKPMSNNKFAHNPTRLDNMEKLTTKKVQKHANNYVIQVLDRVRIPENEADYKEDSLPSRNLGKIFMPIRNLDQKLKARGLKYEDVGGREIYIWASTWKSGSGGDRGSGCGWAFDELKEGKDGDATTLIAESDVSVGSKVDRVHHDLIKL